MVVGEVGGVGARRLVAVDAGVGGCGEGDLTPVGVAAPSAFFFLLLSLLFSLLPFFSLPFFGASSFPTSCFCCLTPSASGALQGKVLELIFGSMEWYRLVRGKEYNAMR